MASSGKVVRIEEIEARPSTERVKFKEETFIFSDDGGRASKLHNDSGTPGLISASTGSKVGSLPAEPLDQDVEKHVDPLAVSSQFGDEEGEEVDTANPLPDGWPRIPALFRRRSCELSNIMFPCVNKAVSHLELIQNIVEEWFKWAEEEVNSRQSSRQSKTSKQSKTSHVSQGMEEEETGTEVGSTSRRKSHVFSTSSVSSAASSKTELSVLGVGYKGEEDETREGKGIDGEAEVVEDEVPYLGAEDVIEEAMTLLARLEHDRQLTEAKLKKEELRVCNLQHRIETLSMNRLIELPQLVQQEHEACIMDVNELQWHVAYSSRSLDRIQNKTNIADVLNKRLKEDIGFVDKHIPLVQEKLELELEAMDKIRIAQLETNKELELVLTRQAKTEGKSREANQKAETERAYIKKELDTVRDELNQISEELACAKRTFNTYTHQSNDTIQQLKDNQQEKAVLEVKNENAKYSEEMQAVKVRDLETLITEAEFEHHRLTNENLQFQQDLDSKNSTFAQKVTSFQKEVRQKENKLRKLKLKNNELEMEIDDALEKIAKCDKQREADQKNMARIKKEMEKTDLQMESTMSDYRKVFAINTAVKEQLKIHEEKALKLEENLKQTLDTLKRQVKDEVHTRTVLAARISSDSSDASKVSTEATQKKEKVNNILNTHSTQTPDQDTMMKVTVVADEVTTAVTQVEDKVVRLRSAQQSKAKKIDDLKQKIQEVQSQQKSSEEGMDNQMKIFEPHYKHLKEDILAYDKKLDHMAWKSELMKKNMDDMNSSGVMMIKVLENTEKQNKTLNEELEELNIQLEAGSKIKNNLKDSIQDIDERVQELENQQKRFMLERKHCLLDLESKKTDALKLNKELASKYRQLQNEFVILKNQLLDIYEDRIKLENTMKDLKQLLGLQMRMHGALVEYFKFRGLHNTAEVEKLVTESSSNGCRVMDLQSDMNKALSSITRFLQNEIVGHSNQPLLPAVTPPGRGKTVSEPASVKL